MTHHIRIATRQSKLALWQAEHVAAALGKHYPDITISLVPITTEGDKILNQPLAKIGGKGLFIKELEVAMLNNQADIAVHSMKDVGVHLPDDFAISCILKRDNPLDAFVSNRYHSIDELPSGAKVGTCSLRRRMNLAKYRADLTLIDLRGNVQTRLNKLDNGEYDAIILACAGLNRLNLKSRIKQTLSADISLPAIGQGAIGIECRQGSAVEALLAPLNHPDTALCVRTERIINQRLEGSCQVPIAAHATLDENNITLHSRIGMPNGQNIISATDSAPQAQADELGHRIADQLIAQGALDILKQLQHD